jgi:multicomponent Na+:H+ antiporter subunit E
MRGAGLFVILFAIWLLWSGLYMPLIIGLGALSCLICVWITVRMRAEDAEPFHLRPALRAVAYFPWLIKEIAAANWNVVRIVLTPGLPIDPVVVRVKASQHSGLGRVVYGNSITLTPGTLTVDVDGDQLTVHALTRAGARALQGGEMNARVARLERPR